MNALFAGMFPYVMLTTTPLFCGFDWPKNLLQRFKAAENSRCLQTNSKKSLAVVNGTKDKSVNSQVSVE
jgi:Vitamin K-dependent gamma-carboxylase